MHAPQEAHDDAWRQRSPVARRPSPVARRPSPVALAGHYHSFHVLPNENAVRTDSSLLVPAAVLLVVVLSALGCVKDRFGHDFADGAVASIGDYHITESELDAAWRERAPAEYTRAQQDAFRLRHRVLDELIVEHLWRQRVAHRGITVEELLAEAIESGTIASIEPVDEAAVTALYEQSGAAEHGVSLAQVRPALVDALEEERHQQAREQYLHLLRREADVHILMAIPRVSIPVAPADPIRGSPDAPIRLVEFSDFHCQFCRDLRPVLERLMLEYGDYLQWVWKDYPLGSFATAAAARCAHDQGMFWTYHDGLFERQAELQPDDVRPLHALAADIGLDEVRFADCVSNDRHEGVVAAEAEAGYLLGVSGTPTVFINGRMVTGTERFETYERILLEEIRLLKGDN